MCTVEKFPITTASKVPNTAYNKSQDNDIDDAFNMFSQPIHIDFQNFRATKCKFILN
jgi:hypothetical protein